MLRDDALIASSDIYLVYSRSDDRCVSARAKACPCFSFSLLLHIGGLPCLYSSGTVYIEYVFDEENKRTFGVEPRRHHLSFEKVSLIPTIPTP